MISTAWTGEASRTSIDRLLPCERCSGVEGLGDDETPSLSLPLPGLTLSRSQISTWATDACLDGLVDMVNRQGHRHGTRTSKVPPMGDTTGRVGDVGGGQGSSDIRDGL